MAQEFELDSLSCGPVTFHCSITSEAVNSKATRDLLVNANFIYIYIYIHTHTHTHTYIYYFFFFGPFTLWFFGCCGSDGLQFFFFCLWLIFKILKTIFVLLKSLRLGFRILQFLDSFSSSLIIFPLSPFLYPFSRCKNFLILNFHFLLFRSLPCEFMVLHRWLHVCF